MLSARHWCAPLSALIKYGAHWSTYYHSARRFYQSMTIFADNASCCLYAIRIFLSKKCMLIFFLAQMIFAGKTRKGEWKGEDEETASYFEHTRIYGRTIISRMALHLSSCPFLYSQIFTLKSRQGVRGLKLDPVVKPAILFLSFTRSRFLSRLNQYTICMEPCERINILIFTGLFTSTYFTLCYVGFVSTNFKNSESVNSRFSRIIYMKIKNSCNSECYLACEQI